MVNNKNECSSTIYIIDTSAVLSGKPFPVDQQECWTVEEIDAEFSEGGSSWRMFRYLLEKGLRLHRPTDSSIKKVKSVIQKMGETKRLSTADQSVLALAVDVKKMKKKPVILTDDYSIQNIASVLNIEFQSISQKGITKTFKWIRRCRGCGRVLSADESICPICGSTAKYVVDKSAKK